MAQQSDQPEYPRFEPEIIPPDHSGTSRPRSWQPSWGDGSGFRHMRGSHRVYVTRLGPFGIGIAVLAVAVLIGAILLALIGALLLWLPVVALVIGAAIVARIFRRSIL